MSKSKVRAKAGVRIAANGYKLCDPLPKGEILKDSGKKQWVIGEPIGMGGFGEIYSCWPHDDKNKSAKSKEKYVMKIDNIEGPLYAEMYFYHKVAKQDDITNWVENHNLKFLGMPKYVASGTHHTKNGKKGYRFLVMEMFGDDLQKMTESKKLTNKIACQVTAQMLNVLEYIHSFGYIHADIKATNILSSLKSKEQFYLVDFGLAEKFKSSDDVHKEEKPDKKRANNGTVEFRSRDAHVGMISRRSDIECLAYNLVLWLSGTLPWLKSLDDADEVYNLKKKFMKNISTELNKCFKSKNVNLKSLQEFLNLVGKLEFKEKPDYKKLENLINKTAQDFSSSKRRSDQNHESDVESLDSLSPPKKIRRGRSSSVGPLINSPAVKTKKPLRAKASTTRTKKASPNLDQTIILSDDSIELAKNGKNNGDEAGDQVNDDEVGMTPAMIAIKKLIEKKKNEALNKKRSKKK